MPKIQSFRDLIAWQKAMELADMIYDVTERFPAREHFGLAYQLRKSAVSIPSNIAEGSRRKTPGYLNHLVIALGSHAELDTQCELATRRRFHRSFRQAASGGLDRLKSAGSRTVLHGRSTPTSEMLIPNP
jgi:four helix bundle protein